MGVAKRTADFAVVCGVSHQVDAPIDGLLLSPHDLLPRAVRAQATVACGVMRRSASADGLRDVEPCRSFMWRASPVTTGNDQWLRTRAISPILRRPWMDRSNERAGVAQW